MLGLAREKNMRCTVFIEEMAYASLHTNTCDTHVLEVSSFAELEAPICFLLSGFMT